MPIHDRNILSAPHTNVKTPPKGVGDYDPKKRAKNLAALKNMGPKPKKVKKEGDASKMYLVRKPLDGMTAETLVLELNPLEGIQPLNIMQDDVLSVHHDETEAQRIAVEAYDKYCNEVQALEEKKGKTSDQIKKAIDKLEKKRKEHVDLAKEDPKNAAQHKEHIAKIAQQIDDLMSKMEKIEKSKKQIEKKEEKKDLKEAYEVHFSDGVRQRKIFKDPKSAVNFAKQLISTNKSLQHVDVFNAGPDFHSTADIDSVIAWWGDGSYMDNKAKKDLKLASKKIQ
jgi:hypothetical protein